MDNLKKCPECGGSAELRTMDYYYNYVRCTQCFLATKVFYDGDDLDKSNKMAEKAIKYWNKRIDLHHLKRF